MDALLDGEPVKLLEDRGNVVSGADVGEEVGRVLYILQFLYVR